MRLQMILLRDTSESQAVLARYVDAPHLAFVGPTCASQFVIFCTKEPYRVCTRDLPVFHQVQEFARALQFVPCTYVTDYSYIHV